MQTARGYSVYLNHFTYSLTFVGVVRVSEWGCVCVCSAALRGGPLDNDQYVLIQFHLHWGAVSSRGSEHKIDDVTCAAEVYTMQSRQISSHSQQWKTLLDGNRGPTDRSLTLTFSPRRAMQKVKVKGHSVQKQTDGQTEAIALPPVLTRSITNISIRPIVNRQF